MEVRSEQRALGAARVRILVSWDGASIIGARVQKESGPFEGVSEKEATNAFFYELLVGDDDLQALLVDRLMKTYDQRMKNTDMDHPEPLDPGQNMRLHARCPGGIEPVPEGRREGGTNPTGVIEEWCDYVCNHQHMHTKEAMRLLRCTSQECTARKAGLLKIFYNECGPEEKSCQATTDHRVRKCVQPQLRECRPNMTILCGLCHGKLTKRECGRNRD